MKIVGDLGVTYDSPIQPYIIEGNLGNFSHTSYSLVSYSYDLQMSGSQRMFRCKKSDMLGTLMPTHICLASNHRHELKQPSP